MSILIRGMEMPTTCCNCKFREPFIGFVHCHLAEMDMEYEESDNCRHPNCPLVELPPHGDLVDLSDTVHPNDSMRRMTIDEQLRRTCEGWSADRKQYVVIEAEGET